MSQRGLSIPTLRWLEVILGERFGHAWSLSFGPQGLELRLRGGEGCITFDVVESAFHKSRSDLAFTRWNAMAEGWNSVLGDQLPAPGVASMPQPLVEKKASGYVIHYDVFGLAYWMLARVEEIGRSELDSHGRFPASASHAYQQRYLERPVVDEWLHVLGQIIQRQWPRIALKKHTFRLDLSHDVDRPSRYLFGSLAAAMRSAAGDVVKRADMLAPFRAVWLRRTSPNALHPSDPYNTFDWLMDVSEELNLQSTFYFMAGRSNPQFDAKYEIGHPAIRSLLRRVYERGHHIGLHPSYECYRDADQLRSEVAALWQVCKEQGIHQSEWGARMHYLRWTCSTPSALEAAGLRHDSSLGYADHPGFRCGTAFAYPFFDMTASKMLNIEIRPLMAMECSVCLPPYLNAGFGSQARRIFASTAEKTKKMQGVVTLLWHNSELDTDAKRNLYKCVIHDATSLNKF